MDDFIAQIAAAPDDDRPRLVYADHLMERGDPQGELIAVQCALARHDATDDDVGDVPRLRVRERALLAAHGSAWLSAAGLADWQGRFRRGFIDDVSYTSGEAFVAQADLLLAKAPLVRSVRVAIGLPHIARWPGATRLVDLYGEPHGAAAFDDSPYLDKLRCFGTYKATPDARALQAIARIPQPIAELDLDFVVNPAAYLLVSFLSDLAACPARGAVGTLRISRLPDLRLFALDRQALPALHTLALAHTRVNELVFASLARPTLEVLDLLEAGPVDVPALLAAAPNLRRLRLSKLGLGDDAALAIAATPNRLVRLDLSRNAITDAGALALARSEHLRGLRYLALQGNQVSELARRALRSAFPNLLLLRS